MNEVLRRRVQTILAAMPADEKSRLADWVLRMHAAMSPP
jgi:hypothetical protein